MCFNEQIWVVTGQQIRIDNIIVNNNLVTQIEVESI